MWYTFLCVSVVFVLGHMFYVLAKACKIYYEMTPEERNRPVDDSCYHRSKSLESAFKDMEQRRQQQQLIDIEQRRLSIAESDWVVSGYGRDRNIKK